MSNRASLDAPTAARLVRAQTERFRDDIMQAVAAPALLRRTKRGPALREMARATLRIPGVLAAWPEKRSMTFIDLAPCAADDNYALFVRSVDLAGGESYRLGLLVQRHACERMLERLRVADLREALRAEIGPNAQRFVATALLIRDAEDFRLGTATGQFRGDRDDGIAVARTWLANRLIPAADVVPLGAVSVGATA